MCLRGVGGVSYPLKDGAGAPAAAPEAAPAFAQIGTRNRKEKYASPRVYVGERRHKTRRKTSKKQNKKVPHPAAERGILQRKLTVVMTSQKSGKKKKKKMHASLQLIRKRGCNNSNSNNNSTTNSSSNSNSCRRRQAARREGETGTCPCSIGPAEGGGERAKSHIRRGTLHCASSLRPLAAAPQP